MLKKFGMALLAIVLVSGLLVVSCGGGGGGGGGNPPVLLWSLAEWIGVYGTSWDGTTARTPLNRSGNPTVTINAEGHIVLTGRTVDYDAIDIHFTDANSLDFKEAVNNYTFKVEGTVDGAAKMKLAYNIDPWSTFASQELAAAGNFALEAVVPAAYAGKAVRVQTENATSVSFTITKIEVWGPANGLNIAMWSHTLAAANYTDAEADGTTVAFYLANAANLANNFHAETLNTGVMAALGTAVTSITQDSAGKYLYAVEYSAANKVVKWGVSTALSGVKATDEAIAITLTAAAPVLNDFAPAAATNTDSTTPANVVFYLGTAANLLSTISDIDSNTEIAAIAGLTAVSANLGWADQGKYLYAIEYTGAGSGTVVKFGSVLITGKATDATAVITLTAAPWGYAPIAATNTSGAANNANVSFFLGATGTLADTFVSATTHEQVVAALGAAITKISALDAGKFLYAVEFSAPASGTVVKWGKYELTGVKATDTASGIITLAEMRQALQPFALNAVTLASGATTPANVSFFVAATNDKATGFNDATTYAEVTTALGTAVTSVDFNNAGSYLYAVEFTAPGSGFVKAFGVSSYTIPAFEEEKTNITAITLTTAALGGFTITVGETPATVRLSDFSRKINRYSTNQTATIVTGGYEVTGFNYDNGLVVFPITLPGKTLADVTSIKYKFTPISGNCRYKDLFVVAYANGDLLPDTGVADADAITAAVAVEGPAANTPTQMNATMNTTTTAYTSLSTASTIYIGFYLKNASADGDGTGGTLAGPTKFAITDIVISFDPPNELVINNPVFSGWGGSGAQGDYHVFRFDTSQGTNCRASYAFPEGAATYTHFEIKFTLTRSDGTYGPDDPAKPMKVVIKDSEKDNWSTPGDTFQGYKESMTDGQQTFSRAKTASNRLTFEHNTDADGSTSFTLTIDSIKFYNE